MKESTLISFALTILGLSWILLVSAHTTKIEKSDVATIADFYVSILDDNGNALPNYIVHIDGKLVGKTNAQGIVSKSSVTIGNTPTVTLNLKSIVKRHEKKRTFLLTLPEISAQSRPIFSVAVSLCLEFVECNDDVFSINAGLIAPGLMANTKTKQSLAARAYDFNVSTLGDGSPETAAIIRRLREKLSQHSKQEPSVKIVVRLSKIGRENDGDMMRIIGKKEGSGSIDNEIAFLLPLKSSAEETATTIFNKLVQAKPGSPAGEGRKFITISSKDHFSEAYEIYAGGVGGQIVSYGKWQVQVPESGRFFLTIVNKGQIIKRKMLDIFDSQHIDLDE